MKKIIACLSLLFIGLTPSHPSQEVQSVDNAIVLDKKLGTTEGSETEKPEPITLRNIKSLKKKLAGADLRDANFTNAHLEEFFLKAGLEGAVFKDAKCQKAVFLKAGLRRANFTNSHLEEAFF